MSEQPVFFYDLASPDAYLALERLVEVLGVVPELQPVSFGPPAFRCLEEQQIHMADVERRAVARGLQPVRWPVEWPTDVDLAMRVATYAKHIGKVAAFSLAAFRQAFAGGRDLAEQETVLIAAAACEIHPAAVLKAAQLRSVRDGLAEATAQARAAGVTSVPTLAVGGELFPGDEALDRAAAA
jgi:2-hydroxychromene-2-carboxylate isomerase